MCMVNMVNPEISNTIALAIENSAQKNGIIRINKTRWFPVNYSVLEGSGLFICTDNALVTSSEIFPCEVKTIHGGPHYGKWQEYLVNNKDIYAANIDSKGEIVFVETLEKRVEEENAYGQMMRLRSTEAKVPWNVVKITRRIEDDVTAIELLKKLYNSTSNLRLSPDDVTDLTGDIPTFKYEIFERILGSSNWELIKTEVCKSKKLSSSLAEYILKRNRSATRFMAPTASYSPMDIN